MSADSASLNPINPIIRIEKTIPVMDNLDTLTPKLVKKWLLINKIFFIPILTIYEFKIYSLTLNFVRYTLAPAMPSLQSSTSVDVSSTRSFQDTGFYTP